MTEKEANVLLEKCKDKLIRNKEIKHVLTLEIISYNKKKGNSLEQCNQELDEMECDFDTAIKSMTILYSLCDGCNDVQKDE